MTGEMLTNGWVKLLPPSFSALVVSATREKVSDFVPLASVLFDSLDEPDILCVRPTTYARTV